MNTNKSVEDPLIPNKLLLILFLLGMLSMICSSTPAFASSQKYQFPEVITVRVTGEQECNNATRYVLEDVAFKDYVKGVLANEWGMDWDEESIKAGAVAVKMYALYTVDHAGEWNPYQILFKGVWQPSRYLERGKWVDAHVYDCDWDMVYNPEIRSDLVDQAVEETWDYILVDSEGDIIQTFFNAWMGGCEEQEVENCMGQWNSLEDAENGMTWKEILNKYYNANLIYIEHFLPACMRPNPLHLPYQFEFCR